MVNVDFSPALVLGAGLVGGGLALYQLRRLRPSLSRDFDVVVSSIAIFSGGILVFQGWRLDPLLLFCQLLTAGMALSFAVEALRLREEVAPLLEEEAAASDFADPRGGGAGPYRGAAPLPPPRAGASGDYYDAWSGGDGADGAWVGGGRDGSGAPAGRYPSPAAAPRDYYDDATPSGYADGRGYGGEAGGPGAYPPPGGGASYWAPADEGAADGPAPRDWGGYGGGGGGGPPDDDWE